MGTKNKPGSNDAWDKAEEDEQRFALLARDPLASDMTRLWAQLVKGDFQLAGVIFKRLVQKAENLPYSPDKHKRHYIEATQCANEMDVWLAKKRVPHVRSDQVIVGESDPHEIGGPGGVAMEVDSH